MVRVQYIAIDDIHHAYESPQQSLHAMLLSTATRCIATCVASAWRLHIVVPAHRQAIFIYFSLNDYAAFLGILTITLSRHPWMSLSVA